MHFLISASFEAGSSLGSDRLSNRPADILVTTWEIKDSAVFNDMVTSPLNSSIISEAVVTAGVAAEMSKQRNTGWHALYMANCDVW